MIGRYHTFEPDILHDVRKVVGYEAILASVQQGCRPAFGAAERKAHLRQQPCLDVRFL